jgi:hypothetical protein
VFVRFSLGSLMAAAVLVPATAFAQAPQGNAVTQACQSEITSLCGATADGRGGAIRCLSDNQAKLGAACAGALKAVEDRRAAFQAACKADLDKLCPAGASAEEKGGGRMACLRTKVSEVSKSCSDALAAMPMRNAKQ